MAKAIDVAKFFINLAQRQAEIDKGDLMTNLRLQKLLYFAQGSYLSRYGKPLFTDAIEAWTFGPVVPSVYHVYKAGGKGVIISEPPSTNAFTEEEYELLLDVAARFGDYSTHALVGMTHEADTPWNQTERGAEIKNESIKAYFDEHYSLPSFDDILADYPVEAV